MTDNTWRQDAACLDTDPAAFFPEGSSNDITCAVRVCKRCPIQSVIGCAREALAIESTERSVVGVWAGIRVSQSSTSRVVALKELHAIAGVPYVDPGELRGYWPRPCNRCSRDMRGRNTTLADKPNTVRHRASGLCDACHRITVGETSTTRIRPAAVAS